MAFAALFVRQLALAVFLGFLVASPLKLGFGRRWLILAVIPSVAACASLGVYARVLNAFGRLPKIYFSKDESLKEVLRDLVHLQPGALKPPLSTALMMVMFAGLFTMPLLALLAPSLVARGSRANRNARLSWIIGFTISATAALVITGNLMPMTGNVLDDFKMGILSLSGHVPAGPPKAFWVCVTAVASAGVSLLLLVLLDLITAIVAGRRDPGATDLRFHTVFLIATGVLYFGPLALTYQFKFDRYVLPILVLFSALVLVRGIELKRPSRSVLAFSMLFTVAYATYSIVTVHDYFAWNRARWAACRNLMEGRLGGEKVAADDIDGGFEFNNQMSNERRIYTTSVTGSLVKNAAGRSHAIAFSELPGFAILDRRSCLCWLPYSPREIVAAVCLAPG
jgi:hypothetical protein